MLVAGRVSHIPVFCPPSLIPSPPVTCMPCSRPLSRSGGEGDHADRRPQLLPQSHGEAHGLGGAEHLHHGPPLYRHQQCGVDADHHPGEAGEHFVGGAKNSHCCAPLPRSRGFGLKQNKNKYASFFSVYLCRQTGSTTSTCAWFRSLTAWRAPASTWRLRPPRSRPATPWLSSNRLSTSLVR